MDRRTFIAASLATPLAYAAPRNKMSEPILLAPKQRLGGDLIVNCNAQTGDDANTGFSSSSPKRTMQAMYEFAKSTYDFNGHGMEIHLAPTGSRYARLKVVSALVGYHIFNVVGDTTDPNACMVEATGTDYCFDVQDYAALGVLNVAMYGGGGGIYGRQHTIIDWGNVAFWPQSGSHINLTECSTGSAVGPEVIYGGAAQHWQVTNNAKISIGCSVNVNSALAFTYFLYAAGNASVNGTPAVSGAGAGSASSGKQYLVQLNAIAIVGATLPGNVAGVAQYGGIFQ